MTAATLTDHRAPAPAPTPGAVRARLTFAGVLRSEWIKVWSLRSTWWSVALTVALMGGIAALAGLGAVSAEVPAGEMGALDLVTPGGYFAQLVLVVLGVLVVTGEYSTGQVRSTLVAVPRRTPVLVAKVLVTTAVAGLTAVLGTLASLAAGAPFYGELGTALDVADPETQRRLIGIPLVLVGIALLGLVIGALVRSTPAGVAAALGLLLVVENVVTAIPLTFFEYLENFLPSTAGTRLIMTDAGIDTLNSWSVGPTFGPWVGYGILLAWVAALGTIAAVLLRRRDA